MRQNGFLENGSRVFKGEVMHLEWWNPSVGCATRKNQSEEVWIGVVGLPLHLWTREILKKLGDCCGGFLAMDKGTTLKTDLLWTRILLKMEGKEKPSSVNILAGARSYELQLWWGDLVMGSRDFSSKEQSIWRDCRTCGGRRVGDTCLLGAAGNTRRV